MEWDNRRVRELRIKLGFTQAEFAKLLGCRQQTVSEWELGIYSPANAYGRLLSNLEQDSSRISNLSKSAAHHLQTFNEEPNFQAEID